MMYFIADHLLRISPVESRIVAYIVFDEYVIKFMK
jgi:hypothetical protein